MNATTECHPDHVTTALEVSEFACPLCNQKMFVIPAPASRGGVFLRCDNKTGCLPHENVTGYGANQKAAFQIAKEKYGK